ncbi:Syntaxin-22 [Zea mays]|uniref:Syntaxin-22 n=1 Tax=Zea mays TaxID=4577 RepID=A0A1D6MI23_MAIZE|nr:Syntaxin-22 [Zea mays]
MAAVASVTAPLANFETTRSACIALLFGHKTRQQITQLLVKDTSDKLKQASEADHRVQVSVSLLHSHHLRAPFATKKIAKDFQAVLKEFQKAQRLAVCTVCFSSGSATELTNLVWIVVCSYNSSESNNGADKLAEQRTQLLESRRWDDCLVHASSWIMRQLVEERDQGIQEIQHQITEVNEIFKDLAVLVHGQGAMIDDIDSHIDNAAASTMQAKGQLSKAAKNSSLVHHELFDTLLISLNLPLFLISNPPSCFLQICLLLSSS